MYKVACEVLKRYCNVILYQLETWREDTVLLVRREHLRQWTRLPYSLRGRYLCSQLTRRSANERERHWGRLGLPNHQLNPVLQSAEYFAVQIHSTSPMLSASSLSLNQRKRKVGCNTIVNNWISFSLIHSITITIIWCFITTTLLWTSKLISKVNNCISIVL